jgi:ribosomal protein L15
VGHAIVALQSLADLHLPTVDRECMRRLGLVNGDNVPIKVLGGAVLSEPVTIIADGFSKGAIAEIERVGGRAVRTTDLPRE